MTSEAVRLPARRRAKPRPFTVGEVLRQVKTCLEEQFLPVLVVGEVSNTRRPRSGHLYLTLRDETANLRVVAFATVSQKLDWDLRDGAEILVWGRMTAYPRTGDVQLVAERLEPVGAGVLRERRERLRQQLEGEGLFRPERKKALPFMPRSIGLVTSPTGAAIQDVMKTLERRFPEVRLVVAPTQVNGAQAAPQIATALRRLDGEGKVDVILLVRGGGSQEDLAAFDQEVVVRAVAAVTTPIVVGVGHETDVSLADLAADRRAATPTAAAELAVPVRRELEAELERRERRLLNSVKGRLAAAERRLMLAARAHGMKAPQLLLSSLGARVAECERRLRAASPHQRLQAWREQLGRAEERLARAPREQAQLQGLLLQEAGRRLARLDPRPALALRAEELTAYEQRLQRAVLRAVLREGEALGAAGQRLDSLSPLKVLARGFSLTEGPQGEVLREASQLQPGDQVRTRLARGSFTAQVLQVEPPEELS